MSPPTRNGGPGRGPAAIASNSSAATTTPGAAAESSRPDGPEPTSQILTARGVWLPPSGRRTIGLWIVGRCPFGRCHGSHAHRGGPDGGRRRAGCGLGDYLVIAGSRRAAA